MSACPATGKCIAEKEELLIELYYYCSLETNNCLLLCGQKNEYSCIRSKNQ